MISIRSPTTVKNDSRIVQVTEKILFTKFKYTLQRGRKSCKNAIKGLAIGLIKNEKNERVIRANVKNHLIAF